LERARKWSDGASPSWSPDGKWIAFLSSDMSNPGLFIVTPDLSERRQLYSPPPGLELSASHPAWSSDSKMLLFSTLNGSIYKVSIDGGDPERLSGPGNDTAPAWCN
jgi:Tol biopolymer transport system component